MRCHYFLIVCVWGVVGCVCVMGCVHSPEGLEYLELELQIVVSCLMWVLDIELRFSVTALHALNQQDISPALTFCC